MSGVDKPAKQASAAELRRERLAAELRANLVKRKTQARSRRAGDGSALQDGPVPDTSPAKS